MRNSVSLACLLSCIFASITWAQCPTTYRSCKTSAPVRTCCPNSQQTTYTVYSNPAPSCHTCSQTQVHSQPNYSQQIVPGTTLLQNQPSVAQTLLSVSPQFWPSHSQPTVSNAAPLVTENAIAHHAPQSNQANCSCSGVAALNPSSPQRNSQGASILENRRNPFSLAGHVREGTAKPVDLCLQEFLNCCESKGKDCMLKYYQCTSFTGEPLRHAACPEETPTIDP